MMTNKPPLFQQLAPEIIYHILSFLPSRDLTTMASFYCRPLRSWTLVLLDERAQQSMVEGWRLMLGTTTRQVETKNEQDKEYICEYKTIDPLTLNFDFTVRAFGKEGYCSLVDDTSFEPDSNDHDILLPWGSSTLIQASILKEKVPTQLLEYATTLPEEYSFTVQSDDYQQLEHALSLHSTLHPEFTITYRIHRPDNNGLVLCIDTIRLNPYWWWSQLDRQQYPSLIGREHLLW